MQITSNRIVIHYQLGLILIHQIENNTCLLVMSSFHIINTQSMYEQSMSKNVNEMFRLMCNDIFRKMLNVQQ